MIIDNISEFFKELQSKIEIKSIKLPNGWNIYYSDVNNNNNNKTINFKVGGFVLKTIDKKKLVLYELLYS